jgi:Flp pilus assembly pilin Flp
MNSKKTTRWRRLTERVADERGQALVEYALVVTIISIAAIAALATLTDKLAVVFQTLGSAL